MPSSLKTNCYCILMTFWKFSSSLWFIALSCRPHNWVLNQFLLLHLTHIGLLLSQRIAIRSITHIIMNSEPLNDYPSLSILSSIILLCIIFFSCGVNCINNSNTVNVGICIHNGKKRKFYLKRRRRKKRYFSRETF